MSVATGVFSFDHKEMSRRAASASALLGSV